MFRRWFALRPAGIGLLGWVLILGCSPPQVSHDHWELLSSLRTACSTRNFEWLGQNEREIAQRRERGLLTEEEHGEFQAILELARNRQWEEAEGRVIQWQRAQRPAATLERRLPPAKPLPSGAPPGGEG